MAVSRFEAEQGSTVRLRVVIQKNNAPFDPASFGKVEIRRRTSGSSTSLVQTISAASIVNEGVGVYYVDWPIPLTQPVGGYVDRWFFTEAVGGTEISRDADFTVFAQGSLTASAGYITIADVRSLYLPDSTLTDAQIATLIEVASEIVDKYTGHYFGGRADTLLADGTGTAWIVMPTTVQSLTSITVTWGSSSRSLDVDDFIIKGRWIIHKDFLPWPNQDWTGCASACSCLFGDVFDRGQKNVAVEGVFGDTTTVPKTIQRATGLLVMHGGRDECQGSAAMAYNFASESIEGHSYSLRDVVQAVELRGSTGIPEVDSLLNMNRRIRGRMSVI